MKKSDPITPGVHLSGLVDIEGMCWNINRDRGGAIRKFKEAVFLALPDDQDARDGHFNAAALSLKTYDYTALLKLGGAGRQPGTNFFEVTAVAVAVSAIEHGVPVATINFLAAIHLSPDLLKE
jgi:hypothetical protein